MTQNYIKVRVMLPNNNISNLFTYVPVAGYTDPGIMAFNEDHFTINTNTNVVSLNSTFYGRYALKTVAIRGVGYLTGGGNLMIDRSIDINTTTKSKIDNALQSLSVPSYMNYAKNGTNANISLKLASQAEIGYTGYLEIKSNSPSDGLYVDLKDAGIIDGSVSQYNKILTKSKLDNTYGALNSSNNWSGLNTFYNRVRYSYNVSPTDNQDLTSKLYVDTGLSTKVDKLTGLGVPSVYVGNPNGSQSSLPLREEAYGGSVPVRDASGNIGVGDAREDSHAVNLRTARTLIHEQIGSVYKPAGSITFAELIDTVDLDESNLGNIYNIKNAFTTTNAFVEGAGISYPAGTNVGVVEINNTYYFDVFAGQVDLSNYYTSSQVDSLLSGKQNTLIFDTTPTDGSNNPVTSSGIKVALDGKQNILTFDSTPMENSTNPVTSGGIKAALDKKVSPNGTVANAEQLVPTTGFTTNNAFNTRKTAAEINTVPDVLNGNVQIKKIKGNTIKWNQLCTNGNFNGTTGWSVNSPIAITSFTASDNVATLEVASSGSIYAKLRYAVIGHKYAMRYTIKSSVNNVKTGTNYGDGSSGNFTQYFTIGTNWTVCSRILEATSTARYFYVYVNTAGTYNVKNAMLFDLTQMFGEGNEPTLDEFNEMFPEEYYAYTDAELVSCKPSGMQTVGFNLCSCASIFEKTITGYSNQITGDDFTTVKNWLKSLQRYNQSLVWKIDNEGYTGSGSGFPVGTLYCRDSSTNPIIAIRPDVEFSLNSIDIDSIYQIFFYGRNDQTITFSNACMHFVWSGARNGDYEPYQQNTLAIDTTTYFPDGMRSTPTVYDEIDFVNHKAITRCDMRAYQSGDESDTTVITDGINTVYPLTTPTEVSIPADANNTYYADDWGTETWLQTGNPNPAAPVGSELLYFVNLRDKLQHLPFLANEDGGYIIKQTGTQMELVLGYSKAQVDAIVGNINSILDSINGEVV